MHEDDPLRHGKMSVRSGCNPLRLFITFSDIGLCGQGGAGQQWVICIDPIEADVFSLQGPGGQ